MDAFPISHLPTPGQEWAGLGGYRGGHTCDCVGKEKHSTANVRSRAPLSPSHHFGKPCPGVMPGPRRTGVGKQDSPKGSGNMGYIQPSLAGQPHGAARGPGWLTGSAGTGQPETPVSENGCALVKPHSPGRDDEADTSLPLPGGTRPARCTQRAQRQRPSLKQQWQHLLRETFVF